MSTVRTPEEWVEVMTRMGKDASPTFLGNRVLGDLVGYRHASKFRQEDAENIGNALLGFMKMKKDS